MIDEEPPTPDKTSGDAGGTSSAVRDTTKTGHGTTMTPSQVERRKLVATLFNSLAVNAITTGILTPVVTILTGTASLEVQQRSIVVVGIALSFGLILHAIGQSILGKLK